MTFVEYLAVLAVPLALERYPSQRRPVLVQRTQAGFASSHLTLRTLFECQT